MHFITKVEAFGCIKTNAEHKDEGKNRDIDKDKLKDKGCPSFLQIPISEAIAGPALLLVAAKLDGGGAWGWLPTVPQRSQMRTLFFAGLFIFLDQFCSLTGVKLADR